MDTKSLGNLGERLACGYLADKGFDIVGKNYRISFGEIDIIARKKPKLFSRTARPIHFVEVKTIIGRGQTQPYYPEGRVDHKKRQKLRNLAQIWLQKNKFGQNTPYQIDIIGIVVNKETRIAKLHYFGNVVGDSPS